MCDVWVSPKVWHLLAVENKSLDKKKRMLCHVHGNAGIFDFLYWKTRAASTDSVSSWESGHPLRKSYRSSRYSVLAQTRTAAVAKDTWTTVTMSVIQFQWLLKWRWLRNFWCSICIQIGAPACRRVNQARSQRCVLREESRCTDSWEGDLISLENVVIRPCSCN